jgi:Icc-related predicted phosphoesterase
MPPLTPSLTRFAVLSDTHLSPAGTPDGMWNNVTCRSVSGELLGAAVAGIASSGLSQVILLGDVSDDGEPGMIAAALKTITGAGMRVWAVPGNHDASRSPNALAEAADGQPDVTVLGERHRDLSPDVVVVGHGLRSHDGGLTCEAVGVPDPAGSQARLLVWASHYPVISQQDRFQAAGLRYPGDLRNLSHVAERVGRFDGPVLVLHGHLHASAVAEAGPVLQIGVPAAVEWPNAWTEVTLEVTGDTVTAATALHQIPGSWPGPVAVTTLAQPVQDWAYAAGHWARSPDSAAT